MSRRRITVLAPMTLLCIALCIYFAACDENPVEPKSAKDYPAYFLDCQHEGANWYFVYHPTSNTVDSFWLPSYCSPVISADGKKMYVADVLTGHTCVVDLDSLVIINQLPYAAPIAVSPDNRLMAVHDSGLSILRISDYSVVFNDTTKMYYGVFSSNSKRFYGVPRAGGVYILDLSDPSFSVKRMSVSLGAVGDVAPSIDETKLFLYLQRPPFYQLGIFVVHDMVADSIIFADTLRPGFGELELTPNGRYVFCTNPGYMLYVTGSPWVTVYDVQQNAIHSTISTAGILDYPYENGIPLSEICISPDGKWLTAIGYRFVLSLDIRRMKFVNHIMLGGPKNLLGLDCQNAP